MTTPRYKGLEISTKITDTSDFINKTIYNSLIPSFPNIISVKLFLEYNLIVKYRSGNITLYNNINIMGVPINTLLDYLIIHHKDILPTKPNTLLTPFILTNIRSALCIENNNLTRVAASIILSMIKTYNTKNNLNQSSTQILTILDSEALTQLYDSEFDKIFNK